jgi:hypothetical protein
MTAGSPVSLLFAEVVFFWQAANYLLSADPIRDGHGPGVLSRRALLTLVWFCVRGGAAAALTVAVAGPQGLPLGTAVFAGCILFPVARWFWTPRRYLAEFEVLGNAGFAVLAHLLIVRQGLHLDRAPFHVQAPESVVAAYTIAAALLIYVVRGGTLIVRGVLDRAGTMPPVELEESPLVQRGNALPLRRALPVDTIELNHGRLIGNVERLILVLFVANAQYTALAFFFAAKGLIRSKDVERRAWADYLILGSLTSFLIAVVAGLLIQMVFRLAGD